LESAKQQAEQEQNQPAPPINAGEMPAKAAAAEDPAPVAVSEENKG
jgi:hypothetical protein